MLTRPPGTLTTSQSLAPQTLHGAGAGPGNWPRTYGPPVWGLDDPSRRGLLGLVDFLQTRMAMDNPLKAIPSYPLDDGGTRGSSSVLDGALSWAGVAVQDDSAAENRDSVLRWGATTPTIMRKNEAERWTMVDGILGKDCVGGGL